jgi:hypothetical protein
VLIGRLVDSLNILNKAFNHCAYQRFNQSTNQPKDI